MPELTPPRLEDFPSKVQQIVLEEVARAPFGVKLDGVLSFGRDPRAVRVRWRIWWRMRNELAQRPHPGSASRSPSYPWIAKMWRRHWTTVINGVSRYETDMLPDDAPLDPNWHTVKQLAYASSRNAHSVRYRKFYPDLGKPFARSAA